MKLFHDSINFSEYINNRKDFYSKLESFEVTEEMVSPQFRIDQQLIKSVSENFRDEISRRRENQKFNNTENRLLKEKFLGLYPHYEPIFEHKQAAIYNFTIVNATTELRKKILTTFIEAKKSGSGWWSQADINRSIIETDSLYIGKVQGALQNRFLQHLGLGHDYTTALKIERWLSSLPELELHFSYIMIKPQWIPHLTDIENVIWKHNTPLIGKKTSVI